jgi:hypothetical protein
LVILAGVLLGQRRIRQLFREDENEMLVLPSDAAEKTEFVWARLRYPSLRASGMWAMRGSWTVDYPKADRTFVQGLRRLTRIHTKSVEQVVDLVSDDIYNSPLRLRRRTRPLGPARSPGEETARVHRPRRLSHVRRLPRHLRVERLHDSLNRGFPTAPWRISPTTTPSFTCSMTSSDRFQVPGIVNYPFDKTHEYDGFEARWRAMRDDRGRVVMAICHNMDLGDAWEWADHPATPKSMHRWPIAWPSTTSSTR